MALPRITAYLSGVENATTDFALRPSYISLSKRSGAPSFYAITVPLAGDMVAAFTDRPDGKVYWLKDGAAWEYFNVTQTGYARGARSASFTVSGERQETNAAPLTGVAIASALVTSGGLDFSGKTVLAMAPFAVAVAPGDGVIYQGLPYTLQLLSLQLGVARQNFSLTLE